MWSIIWKSVWLWINWNVKISQYSAVNRHNQLYSANLWIMPEIWHCIKSWQEWLLSFLVCFRGELVWQCKGWDIVKIDYFKSTKPEENEKYVFYVMWSRSCVVPGFPLKNLLFLWPTVGDHYFPFIIMAIYEPFEHQSQDISQFRSIRLHYIVFVCYQPCPHYGR